MNRLIRTITTAALVTGSILTAGPAVAFPTGTCLPVDTLRIWRHETRMAPGLIIHRSRLVVRRTVRCDDTTTRVVTRHPWKVTVETYPIVGTGNTR